VATAFWNRVWSPGIVRGIGSLLALCVAAIPAVAQPPAPATPPNPASSADPPAELSIEQLTERGRKSIVVVTFSGRDGRNQGLGSGFIISPDGLIATNLHVLGEGRPVQVQLSDGRQLEVQAIEAFDRHADLAVLRVAAQNLPPLELADSQVARQGQSIIALGNPQGLKYSVVAGVLSGTQEINGREMLQLAIPVEPGNSGGPVLDRQGRVLGIVTMKSAVTENLGFAMPANELKALLAKPNPTQMSRWLTIGALDPAEWSVVGGGRWRQRAGRIHAEGLGTGFGGRTLCLAQLPVPTPTFDVAVQVKLADEEGAAGLVFHADGGDRHYGFYPTNGRLRMTAFQGADVNSWKILADLKSAAYRPGEWNHLQVRRTATTWQCRVNGEVVLELAEESLAPGRVGLAKFRNTVAEFRNFRLAPELTNELPPPELRQRVAELAGQHPPTRTGGTELARQLGPGSPLLVQAVRERARELDRQAAELRQTAQRLHETRVLAQLEELARLPDAQVDLARGALLIAQLDNEEVDVDAYLRELDRMATEVARELPEDARGPARLQALNNYLFEQCGFHGARGDHYAHRSNSYLNEVLDDREGLPLTLSMVYIELARRLGVPVAGIPLPGHFVVRHEAGGPPEELIDVYERAAPLTPEAAEQLVRARLGRPLQHSDLVPATRRAMLQRMLQNLLGLAERQRETASISRLLDALLVLEPEDAESRVRRALLRYSQGRGEEALADVRHLEERRPDGLNLEQLDQLKQAILKESR